MLFYTQAVVVLFFANGSGSFEPRLTVFALYGKAWTDKAAAQNVGMRANKSTRTPHRNGTVLLHILQMFDQIGR